MKKKVIYREESFAFPIKLEQTGKHSFSVTYGEEVNKNLDYTDAAHVLGESILHALGGIIEE